MDIDCRVILRKTQIIACRNEDVRFPLIIIVDEACVIDLLEVFSLAACFQKKVKAFLKVVSCLKKLAYIYLVVVLLWFNKASKHTSFEGQHEYLWNLKNAAVEKFSLLCKITQRNAFSFYMSRYTNAMEKANYLLTRIFAIRN